MSESPSSFIKDLDAKALDLVNTAIDHRVTCYEFNPDCGGLLVYAKEGAEESLRLAYAAAIDGITVDESLRASSARLHAALKQFRDAVAGVLDALDPLISEVDGIDEVLAEEAHVAKKDG